MHKYVTIFHANLNYAFLIPENYEQVIRASYEVIIDTFREKCPNAKYVFEASGYTIDKMAQITPDVLEKLKDAINRGQCEFMGAPYSHPIMANIPEEDGYWSCEFAMRTYDKHLGFRPESFWNPECTWMQYVPRAYRQAGVKYLTLDFESYMVCNDPQYGWVERNRTSDIGWGGHLPWYDLSPNCKFLHQPFRNIVPGLHGMCRSDRLVGKYIGYFLGHTPLKDYMDNVKKWTGDNKNGATIIIADDAEYTGTTGYHYVKRYQDYSRCFAVDPNAAEKLENLVKEVLKIGELATFREACELEPLEEPFFVEDRFAWHRTFANAWAGTPEARAWDPVLNDMRKKYKDKYQPIVEAEENKENFKEIVEKLWFHLTNSANSDGRWPPPPAQTCAFNRQWVLDEMDTTRKVLDKIRDLTRGMESPKASEDEFSNINDPDNWDYGYHFTDKDPEKVQQLNNYELQHAIYYAHKMVDSADKNWKAKGKKLLKEVFDELDRRGMKGIRPPSLR